MKIAASIFLSSVTSVSAFAGMQIVDNTTITQVFVNGGVDTANPGTTCLQISSPVSSECTNAVIAIPNNNKQLLAAALTAKSIGSNIWFYYETTGSFHCPGITLTPCSVISISIK